MEERLDMQSPNWVNKNSQFIAERFPNCVTETSEGIKVDFELLKQELSSDIIEGNKERYRLEWPGKREAIVTANLPTTKTLRPVREDSVDFDNTENIYIEGDNLEVLKLLQESYLGKVKMIYIDPPYNTGKDFVYKDNFSKDSKEELLESGQKDEYNQRLVVNPENAGRYHSDWLSMMYPRLKLARNLLTDDGVIFMSIDDNEVHNLRKIGDEIFGESNFVAELIWEKNFAPKNDAKYFSSNHEQILCYAKGKNNFKRNLLPMTEEQIGRYKNMDNDSRGVWQSDNLTASRITEKDIYPITTPSGKIIYPSKGNSWRVSISKFQELKNDDRIWFGKEGDGVPRLKRFLTEIQQGKVPQTILKYKDVGHTQEGRQEIKKIFSGNPPFDYPKPVRLLSHIIRVGINKDDIVLDFFSGSASTAHSIMHLNAEDGGNRKFIMAQLPESTDEKSEAFKAGYKNICEIGKERIRRAGKQILEESKAKAGELEFDSKENNKLDVGFRVYRLDESNMQDVYYKPQEYSQTQLDAFADNVKPDRTADDLLAQVMLDWGLPLSLKIEQATISGKKVFKVAGNSLYACFDTNIDEVFIKEIAKEEPMRIVFKDSGFRNDTAKVNVKQLLKQLSPETEMKVL
jgi:adenine-specific DNA-methyltransferase